MTTTNKTTSDVEHDHSGRPTPPLALHVRRLRLWYPKRSITQEELAAVSGAHIKQVQRLERVRRLPTVVEDIIALAHTLGVSVEALIAPGILERIKASTDARRAQLRLELGDDTSGCRRDDG